jgi:hypothetical protein
VSVPPSITRSRWATAAFGVVLPLCAATGCAAGGGVADGHAPASASTSATSSPSGSTDPRQDPALKEQSLSENETQPDRDAITANFHARQRAMVDGDTAELRRLSTPDSRAEHISGYDQPRDEWFDQIDSGYFGYVKVDGRWLSRDSRSQML